MGTLHVRLDFPLSTSSLWPSNSMICRGNGPKRPPEAPNADSHKPRIGHIFGYMAQNAIPRAPTPPATPQFCGFHPSKLPKWTSRPPYLGPLGCGKLRAQAQTGLASKQQAAGKQQASSTREMGQNQNSVVVLRIQVNFWWMIPMGVKYNHTKFEQETQRWRPGTGFASGGPRFQKLQFRAKNSHFWA